MKLQPVISDEEALKTGMKSGEMFYKYLNAAIECLEASCPDNIGKITVLGWVDIEDQVMKQQQTIIRKHYNNDQFLKKKIGKS